MRIVTPEKFAAILAGLKERRVDAVLISDFETGRNKNLRYLSGHPSDAQLLLFADGSSSLVVWDVILANQMSQVDQIVDVGAFGRSYRAAAGLGAAPQVGREIHPGSAARRRPLPGAATAGRISSGDHLLSPGRRRRLIHSRRMLKTPSEIATLREGAQVTNDLIAAISPLREGTSGSAGSGPGHLSGNRE